MTSTINLRLGVKMRLSSYISRFLAVALVLVCTESAAKANGVDPQILLGPTGSTISVNQTDCVPNNIGSCFLTVDANGNGIADVTNNLGAFIIQDTVTLISTFIPPLTCAVGENAPGWSPATPLAAANSCVFNGGFISPGFTYGLSFLGFAPNSTVEFDLFAQTASMVPEPGTMVLLGMGLVALAMSRKRLNRRQALGLV